MVMYVSLLWFLLFGLCPISVPDSIPIGMFRTECHDRHFWLSVNSNFLGHKFRFNVQADSKVHEVSGQWAAECGYTMALDSWGDLLLRVSYLACLVENQRETEFQLLVWFINQDSNGKEKSYPLLLTCPLQVPWAPRELVCEQNYMEVEHKFCIKCKFPDINKVVWKHKSHDASPYPQVSVLKLLPPDNHIGTAWVTPAPVELGEGLLEWRVVFRIPAFSQGGGMREETVPVRMAHLLGYHINTTDSRILLRCAYGSKLAYMLQWGETDVEVVSATILYKLKWTLLTVDMSVACTIGQARMDGSDVLWSLPRDLPTLVHPPFIEKVLKLGVGGRYLSECVAHQRGYMIHDNNRTLELRIPFGAEGGFIKSHVIDGLYSQSYFVDVFLLREWEDTAWSLTQQRIFRALFIQHLPRPVTLINKTVPSQREFSISLCCFPHDVSLGNVTVAGQPVLWEEMEWKGVHLSQNPFPNNTYMYLFQMPFSNSLIPQKYLGDRFRRYTLYGVFSFILFPDGEIYNHSATVEAELQDVVLPKLKGECTARGVHTLAYYGNIDSSEWRLYVGGMRVDWELVELGGFSLDPHELYLSLEVPLYAPGMAYEGLGLQGLLVSVLVSLVHLETAEEQTHVQRCVFPVRELLVCLPDGRMVVMVDTAGVSPPVNPNHTALLDPACRPLETDNYRAIFSFSLDSCGTVATHDGDQVIYRNEVRNMPPFPPHLRPLSQPQPHYRVSLGCVHPENGSRTLAIYLPSQSPTLLPMEHAHKTALHSHTRHPEGRVKKIHSLPAGG
uniref:ZP domain-containing protein n=1 Tax=Cyprinus carpio TaxID=7962 RepID=A0A8C1NEX9_CYPCA